MVFPALGGDTMSARWPKPNGQMRSTTRWMSAVRVHDAELRKLGALGKRGGWNTVHRSDPAVGERDTVAAAQARESHRQITWRREIPVNCEAQVSALRNGIKPAGDGGHGRRMKDRRQVSGVRCEG